MITVKSLKKRAGRLAEKEAGKIVLIFTDHPEQVDEQVKSEPAAGNIPLVFPEEDRNL